MNPARSSGRDDTRAPLDMAQTLKRFHTQAETLAHERRRLPHSARARLEKLLQEIDETVLPRRLRVRCNTGADVDLAVSNRRLFAIRDCALANARTVSAAGGAMAFAEKMLDLSKRAAAIENLRATPDQADLATELSCTTSALRQALGLDAQSGGLDALIDQIGPRATARLLWDASAKKLQFAGNTDWKPFLRQQAMAMTQHAKSSRASCVGSRADVTGIAAPVTASDVLICAFDGARGLAAVVPRSLGLNVVAAWQITG